MNFRLKRSFSGYAAAVMFSMFGASSNAYAVCDGCVVSAVGTASMAITGAITAMGGSLATLLHEIDINIAGIGAKLAGTAALNGNMQREMAGQVQQQAELDRAGRETRLPIDPCATSGSNYAMQASRAAARAASSFRPGGGGAAPSDASLNHALNAPAPSIESSRRMTTAIHQNKYCGVIDAQMGYCKVSKMPDADANADTLYIGAGMPGKDVDLTFTPQQVEAAEAWARMATDPEPPQNITKNEAKTEQGKIYIAMQKAYQANVSTAQNSIYKLIADRQPFEGSDKLIDDVMQSGGAPAQQYWTATQSASSKSLGKLSWAELKSFEAGRRWRNPYWIIQMGAAADPTQLQRELLFTTAFMSDMIYENQQSSEHIEVLLGQILAELTHSNKRAPLDAQLQRVHATNAK